ncbi:MAG: hypothetical protein Q7I93_03520 [Syntrophales bacterium]|nr:hypothetical protein [Syntrophales bacterium]
MKSPPTNTIDAAIAEAVKKSSVNDELACADATAIAVTLNKPMPEVGLALDLLEVSITKCQLGLFGYYPQKRIVSPAQSIAPELEQAIRERLVNGALPCDAAWEIAENLALPKMKIASACEAMKVRIKPCQLGAF